MEYGVKVTVLDKKIYPELQAQYCAVPDSGKCPCFNVGDEFMFYRNDERDDFWHMGTGTLIKSGEPDEGTLLSPALCIAAQKEYRSARKLGTQSAGTFTPLCKAVQLCTVGRTTIKL